MHPAFHASAPVLLRKHALHPLPRPASVPRRAAPLSCARPSRAPAHVAVAAAAAAAAAAAVAVAAALSGRPPAHVSAFARTPTAAPLAPATVAAAAAAPGRIDAALRVHRAAAVAAATPPAAAVVPTPASVADRVSFWAGEFLMWNPAAKVLALLAVTLGCMFFGSFLYRMADPEGKEAAYPFWHAVRAIANPLEDDWQNNSLRTTSIALAAIGMIVFAILVGMVTESVEAAVRNADGEMSRVILSDHILVCGWGPHVSQILKDVSTVASKVKVVVLASPAHKHPMRAHLRDALSEDQRSRLRIFYRPGAPLVSEDLRRVAAERASKIILVNSRRGDLVDADRRILSRALALRQNLPAFTGDIVAELNSVRDEGILRSILADTNARSVETINAEQLLFRFMAQAIRQPGLADIVATLMGDDPSSVFHVMEAKQVAPQLVGSNLADLRPTSIPGSVLCGFIGPAGEVNIGLQQAPGVQGETLKPDAQLLLLGTRRPSREVGMEAKQAHLQVSRSTAARMQSANESVGKSTKRGPESFLVCGWRADMEEMIGELDKVLAHGSQITILDEDIPESIPLSLKNVSVKCVRKRPDRYENLQALLDAHSKPYDHVVVLGSALGVEVDVVEEMGREEDTKTLASLVYVNELLAKQDESQAARRMRVKPTMVTVEFVNERVAEMAKDQRNLTNAILPQNLSAKIAAQTVRDSRLNAVWRELLSQRGREVYLRPCGAYADVTEKPISFATMADTLAKSTDDIVVGYVTREGRAVINPQDEDKFKNRSWDRGDVLIVLSDE